MNSNKALTLSIVIPVYNEERYLKACLDAIVSQTVKPDEVIVVDNNSKDASREIAENYRFVKIISEKKQGIVYARDAGFNTVTCDIIGRIDADTVLPPNWVAKVKRFYDDGAHKDYGLTGGGYFYNFRLPKLNGWMLSQLAYRLNRFISGFYILWGSNMAFPKHLWDVVKNDVCHRDDIHEDLDLAIHLHRLGFKIHYQENLRVGVALKRVWSDRRSVHKHMRRWPITMKSHGFRLWWLGSVGNVLLWYIFQPIFISAEYVAELFGRPTLK